MLQLLNGRKKPNAGSCLHFPAPTGTGTAINAFVNPPPMANMDVQNVPLVNLASTSTPVFFKYG